MTAGEWLTKPLPLEAAESIKVWRIDWDGYLVRGTTDIETARRAVAFFLHRDDDLEDIEIDDWFARHSGEVGWYRTNPCICGEEHRFDMDKVDGPGRGNFQGVYFS